VIKDVLVPYTKRSILGGIILAFGRALGETMAVAFVLGNNHKISFSLLDATATITVTLANEFTEADSEIYLSSLFYIGLILFVLSFILLGIAKYILLRRKES
ncbi:MAG: ABC transporter permease subunit, partial [Calditrichia bacterium]|nr:ABC transporter permease subunit [Calditrichia bacterium]